MTTMTETVAPGTAIQEYNEFWRGVSANRTGIDAFYDRQVANLTPAIADMIAVADMAWQEKMAAREAVSQARDAELAAQNAALVASIAIAQ